jgi:SH3-like domain-containing protein
MRVVEPQGLALTVANSISEVGATMATRRANGTLRALCLAWALLGLWHGAVAQEQGGAAVPAEPPAVASQVPGPGRSTGLPVPRFVSLEADRVYLRYGPGREYPVSWVLARKGLPVEIIAEFDTWRKVKLHDGDEGWIHASLLSSRRTAMIQNNIAEMRRTPADDARVVLRAEPGVIGELLDCTENWCRVDIQGRRGWLRRDAFWGALPGESLP